LKNDRRFLVRELFNINVGHVLEMKNMRCHNIQKKLSAYQDKELKPQELEEVRRHLLDCQSCRTLHERLEQTWQTLGELEEIRPDPWFYPRLAIKIKESREKTGSPVLQHVFQLLRTPAIASILLAIGILAGTYLGNILVRCDFLSSQSDRTTYTQEVVFDSLKAFNPAPPGTLAHGYLQMVNYEESESR
jgi:anti-sigma factor RsiW